MRILTLTSLFPRTTAPSHGVFILERMRAVAARGIDVRVVAPLPWAPPGPVPARYARLRATPDREVVGGLPVAHPRYLMLPRVGMRLQAGAYARSVLRAAGAEIRAFGPDLVDAHYLYPDVRAAASVARELGVPLVASARGSDVKVLGRIPFVARRVREALDGAGAAIAVSRDLADHMRRLGLVDRAVDVIPNGIDASRFRPRSRTEARAELGLPPTGRIVVCVGNLKPEHGQELLLDGLAAAGAPAGTSVHLLGEGPDRAALERRVRANGLEGRVRLHGAVPHERVPLWFAAADASAMLSSRAGSPNVVLESLACGTPCLVSDIPEMREAIPAGAPARFVPREAEAVARGLAEILEVAPDPHYRPRTWDDVAGEVVAVFERVLRTR